MGESIMLWAEKEKSVNDQVSDFGWISTKRKRCTRPACVRMSIYRNVQDGGDKARREEWTRFLNIYFCISETIVVVLSTQRCERSYLIAIPEKQCQLFFQGLQRSITTTEERNHRETKDLLSTKQHSATNTY